MSIIKKTLNGNKKTKSVQMKKKEIEKQERLLDMKQQQLNKRRESLDAKKNLLNENESDLKKASLEEKPHEEKEYIIINSEFQSYNNKKRKAKTQPEVFNGEEPLKEIKDDLGYLTEEEFLKG